MLKCYERNELDLLTRFHHENKSNYECLVEDNGLEVSLDGSQSTCEGNLIHSEERKRVSPLSFGRGKKRFNDVYVDEGFIGKKIAETLGTAHRNEYAFSNSSQTYQLDKPIDTDNQSLNDAESEESLDDIESSDDEDIGTALKKLVGKGRGRSRGVLSRTDQAVGSIQLRVDQPSSMKEATVTAKKPAYFPEFDYSQLNKGSWWSNNANKEEEISSGLL